MNKTNRTNRQFRTDNSEQTIQSKQFRANNSEQTIRDKTKSPSGIGHAHGRHVHPGIPSPPHPARAGHHPTIPSHAPDPAFTHPCRIVAPTPHPGRISQAGPHPGRISLHSHQAASRPASWPHLGMAASAWPHATPPLARRCLHTPHPTPANIAIHDSKHHTPPPTHVPRQTSPKLGKHHHPTPPAQMTTPQKNSEGGGVRATPLRSRFSLPGR